MTDVIYLIPAVLLCMLVHEGGHFLMAFAFGHRLKFRFEWGKWYVPRFVWGMPEIAPKRQALIAAAGFGAEFILVPFLLLAAYRFGVVYLVAVFTHFIAYRSYAGEQSDFKWIKWTQKTS